MAGREVGGLGQQSQRMWALGGRVDMPLNSIARTRSVHRSSRSDADGYHSRDPAIAERTRIATLLASERLESRAESVGERLAAAITLPWQWVLFLTIALPGPPRRVPASKWAAFRKTF
jgi:hypothetical protein